jgi:hypothetical protein
MSFPNAEVSYFPEKKGLFVTSVELCKVQPGALSLIKDGPALSSDPRIESGRHHP